MVDQWEVCQQEMADGHWEEMLNKESCHTDLWGSSLYLFMTMVLNCRLARRAGNYIFFIPASLYDAQ